MAGTYLHPPDSPLALPMPEVSLATGLRAQGKDQLSRKAQRPMSELLEVIANSSLKGGEALWKDFQRTFPKR